MLPPLPVALLPFSLPLPLLPLPFVQLLLALLLLLSLLLPSLLLLLLSLPLPPLLLLIFLLRLGTRHVNAGRIARKSKVRASTNEHTVYAAQQVSGLRGMPAPGRRREGRRGECGLGAPRASK